MLADAGTTDLLPQEHLPSDEGLCEDEENVIPGHEPPDYHAVAHSLQNKCRHFVAKSWRLEARE